MKRMYSKEFKVKACEAVVKDGIKHAAVAEELGISKIMLYRWIDEYETHGDVAFVGKGHLRSEAATVLELQRENERLKTELEVLRKQAHTLQEQLSERVAV